MTASARKSTFVGTIGIPVLLAAPRIPEASQPLQQPEQLDHYKPDSLSLLPAPAPTLAQNTAQKAVTRSSKGPSQRSRVEKPAPKRRSRGIDAKKGVGRSARLSRQERRRSM